MTESMLKTAEKICKNNFGPEYLDHGGNVFEIVKLLDSSDRKNDSLVTTVFSAMHKLIMKIIVDHPEKKLATTEACQHLLNSHLASIHSMLSVQSNVKQRRTVLKLLTAVVSLGGTLPRELLNHLSLHGELVDALTRQTHPSDSESVRTCFIHFILSFLVEGKVSDIRALLEKRGVISSIFADLIYDQANLVHLVLSTIRKFVLELPGISKTTKLHVFSTPVLQNLVRLYNWKGPKNWTGNFKKQKTLQNEDVSSVDPEEKEIAVDAVHEFLLVLLTSNQKGIIFHDRTLGITSANKHNPAIVSILQCLDRPWEYKKPADLVVQILTACPDLIKSQLSYAEPFLPPRVSQKWIYLTEFIQKVIDSINIENSLRLCSPELSTTQLANAVANITLPLVVLKNAVYPALDHEHFIPQHEGIKILSTMLKKIEAFSKAVEKAYCDIPEFTNFKHILTQYILKHLPNFGIILKVWKQIVLPDNENSCSEIDRIPDVKERISAVLQLLNLYKDVCPQLLADLDENSELKPSLLFTGLDKVTEDKVDAMKVDALYLLLAMDSIICLPEEKMFSSALSFLISKIGDEDISKSRLHQTVKLLLNKTGMFEGCSNQTDIWIDAVTHFNDVERIEVANWVVKIIKRSMKNIEKYVALVHEAEENCGEEINAAKLEDIFKELLVRNVCKTKASMQLLVTVSPLICTAIESVNKNPTSAVVEYISIVLVQTLHCQVAPGALQYLSKDLKISSKKYITSWGNAPTSLSKTESKGAMHRISKILLSNDDNPTISTKDNTLIINNEKFTLTFNEIMRLFEMSIFYFVQFTKRENLTEKIEVLKLVIISLLKIAKNVEKDESEVIKDCVKWIFTHPTTLHYFEPVYKKKSSVEYVFTKTLLDICVSINDIDNSLLTLDVILPFREKFVNDLMSAVKKRDKEIFVEFVDLLHVDVDTANNLLTEITNSPAKSSWSVLLPKLLNISSEAKVENLSLVKRIFSCIVQSKATSEVDYNEWYCSLYTYLKKHPRSINAVDGKMFLALLKNITNPNLIKLLSLCIAQNGKFVQPFVNFVTNDKNLDSLDVALKFFSSNLKHKWGTEFVSVLSNAYQSKIVEYLNDSSMEESWIEDDVEAVMYLIQTFSPEICKEICKKILISGDQLEGVKIHRIKLIQSCFKRYSSINKNAMVEFLQFLLYVAVSSLKKDSKNSEKLGYIQKVMVETIDDLRKNNCSYEELNKNHSWPQFTRFSLKQGLKISKENKFSLKPLINLCDIAYKNNCNEEYAKTIFEMATSHSEFLNIMLGSSEVKRDLLELLWILVKKNHSVMCSSQVSLYLSAYNATLDASDQFILMILQHYESNGIKLDEHRPYLWGNAAAEHYSIKGVKDTALFRQPTTSQVMDLLNPEIVANTVKNFPVHRSATSDKCHLTKCPEEVYDPAFYLPVFSHLLAENNVVACHKVIHCGVLAMAIAACSSSCSQIRMAAYTVISNFYFHLEATRSKQKLLTVRFIDSLRNGIVSLETPLEDIRLNGFVSTFLARTSLITTEPLNPLYSPLQTFMMAKPALVLDTIPELLQLFHSAEIEHYNHRHWILEVIRDGLKTDSDMAIALKCVLFKILFGFYTSVLADRTSKLLILEILKSVSMIPKSIMLLVTGYSLIPWLTEISEDIRKSDFESIKIVTEIVTNISDVYTTLSKNEKHCQLLRNVMTKLNTLSAQKFLYT